MAGAGQLRQEVAVLLDPVMHPRRDVERVRQLAHQRCAKPGALELRNAPGRVRTGTPRLRASLQTLDRALADHNVVLDHHKVLAGSPQLGQQSPVSAKVAADIRCAQR